MEYYLPIQHTKELFYKPDENSIFFEYPFEKLNNLITQFFADLSTQTNDLGRFQIAEAHPSISGCVDGYFHWNDQDIRL